LISLLRRFQELVAAKRLEGKVVFTASRGRSSSFLVRGVQVARAAGASAVRRRFLTADRLERARLVVWVAEPDEELALKLAGKVPQALDVVQRWDEPLERQFPRLDVFDAFIANTPSMRAELREAMPNKPVAIIPHHHCNRSGYRLSPERLQLPKVLGYVGAPGHLHDAAEIEELARSKGLAFQARGPFDLGHYRAMDLGVAWTHDEPKRTRFRSNVKHANFCAHGVPSVLPRYESYLAANAELGGDTCLFADTKEEMLAALVRLIEEPELRSRLSANGFRAYERYGLQKIAGEYLAFFKEFHAT
jgi:glycosyltransferase involved in cell wall biosynthesis